MESQEKTDPLELGNLLLEIGADLLGAGASCSRITNNLRRISSVYGYILHLTIHPNAVDLGLMNAKEEIVFNGMRNVPHQGVNFEMLTRLSKLSWETWEHKLPIRDLAKSVKAIRKHPHYPRLLVLSAVSLAGSSFCYTFGGTMAEMLIAFGGTFVGLWSRQEVVRLRFNPYIAIFTGSLVASVFTGLFIKWQPEFRFDRAFATSVLFLVPGVPLINSFTDMLEGYVLNGLARGFNALLTALSIAMGLLIAMKIVGLNSLINPS